MRPTVYDASFDECMQATNDDTQLYGKRPQARIGRISSNGLTASTVLAAFGLPTQVLEELDY